jgi:CDP-diacylglycerol--glycerol-3-phosphate 3-phosphatidyltransferase
MILNIPNNLTLLRIAMIPCFILVFYISDNILSLYQKNLIATLIFLLAAITDWLDGYLARKLNQTSDFGAFIDPVADKLIVIAALILLVQLNRIDSIVAFIIIAREFTISSLREWMATLGKSGSIAVAFIGKLKTTMQMIAILFLLYYENILFIPIVLIGKILIYIAALLTIISMIYYLKIAFKILKEKKGLL